jgi:hypothetical protein
MLVPSQQSVKSCIYLLVISISIFFLRCLYRNFWAVPTMWYMFLLFILWKLLILEGNRVLSINLAIVLHIGNYGFIVLYTLQLIIGDYIALKVWFWFCDFQNKPFATNARRVLYFFKYLLFDINDIKSCL